MSIYRGPRLGDPECAACAGHMVYLPDQSTFSVDFVVCRYCVQSVRAKAWEEGYDARISDEVNTDEDGAEVLTHNPYTAEWVVTVGKWER